MEAVTCMIDRRDGGDSILSLYTVKDLLQYFTVPFLFRSQSPLLCLSVSCDLRLSLPHGFLHLSRSSPLSLSLFLHYG